MRIRRNKSLHQQQAEGTDLLRWETPPEPAEPGLKVTSALDALHGGRPRRWDVVAMADAPLLVGDDVHFVALDDGSLVTEEKVAEGAVDPLAEALEEQLRPPYRAEAVRNGERWAVAANAIDVVELPEEVPGDRVELVKRGEERELTVDDAPSLAAMPSLEAYGDARGGDYVARADRIDGDLWEVQISPL
jgi:hypothetical protein